MIFVVVLVIGVLAVATYLVFVLGEVPGMADERLGKLEALPADVNQWKPSSGADADAAKREGLLREERLYLDERGGGKLFRQVRYRSTDTDEIVKVEPEVAVKRRRIRV